MQPNIDFNLFFFTRIDIFWALFKHQKSNIGWICSLFGKHRANQQVLRLLRVFYVLVIKQMWFRAIGPRIYWIGVSASCVRQDRGSQQTAEEKRKWKHRRFHSRYTRTHAHSRHQRSGTSTVSTAGWSNLCSLVRLDVVPFVVYA